MKYLIGLGALAGGMLLLGLYLQGEVAEKQASMFSAQAFLVVQQSQARLDFLGGMMPYTILGLGVIAGAVIITVVALGIFGVLFIRINQDGEIVVARRKKQCTCSR